MIEHVQLVAGRLSRPARRLPGRLDDPDTGADLGPQLGSSDDDVEAALVAADEAWADGGWSGADPEARGEALERLADELDARLSAIALAEAIDTGVPLAVTGAIAGSLGATVRAAVAEARAAGRRQTLPADGRRVEVLRLPWGPAALLAPWNAPAPVAVTKLANALAAGCPAVLKPSEHAPASAGLIAQAAVDAGLPPGALQVVHGGPEVALRLAADRRVRAISLTGGVTAGAAIAAAAAPHMAALQLELGASNPAVVLEDANVQHTAAALVAGMTKLNGQWCEAPRRVLVTADVHDGLVDALEAALAEVTPGPARDPSTTFGPLAHRTHLERLRAQVAGLDGEVVVPAAEPSGGGGLHFAPCLVLGIDPDRVRCELFGPVLTIHGVADAEAALTAANGLGDGLAGYVFSGDEERAFAVGSRVHAGEVRLGGTNLLELAAGATQSFWGTSGQGAHGARAVFEAFRGSRVVGQDDPGLPI